MILREGTSTFEMTNTGETIGQPMLDGVSALEPTADAPPASAVSSLFSSVCESVKAAGTPTVFVFEQVSELAQFLPQWEDLTANAADTNVFYESWMLLPALRSYHSDRDFRFALIFGPNPEVPSGTAILYGLFPFERRRKYRGIPCAVLKLTKHRYMELCTPLVRRALVAECVTALLDWMESDACDTPLLEFRFLGGEQRVTQEIHAQVYQRRIPSYQTECSARALFRPAADKESFLNFALSGKRRKEFRRLEKRLSESGHLEYKILLRSEDPAPWVESFLRLEAKGWKGEEGSAMALRDDRRGYFQQIATAAHQAGKLMMLGLFLDDRPVALKCNFLSGHGSFAFKIAFDEEFARFSPGVLLEIENVRSIHDNPNLAWMDSCAIPKHFMINRLWPDRRTIETFVMSTGKAPGSLAVAALPGLRWMKRTVVSVAKKFRKDESDQSNNPRINS